MFDIIWTRYWHGEFHAMISIAFMLVALGGLVQLIWPKASVGLNLLVIVAYLYCVKQIGWNAAPEITPKVPHDQT